VSMAKPLSVSATGGTSAGWANGSAW
jgi:hypothetical protein